MVANLKLPLMLIAITCLAVGVFPSHASAVTAELARKCTALTTKQFPPREPGNPAAGSAKGAGRAQNEYFKKCVANNGNMDAETPGK